MSNWICFHLSTRIRYKKKSQNGMFFWLNCSWLVYCKATFKWSFVKKILSQFLNNIEFFQYAVKPWFSVLQVHLQIGNFFLSSSTIISVLPQIIPKFKSFCTSFFLSFCSQRKFFSCIFQTKRSGLQYD